MRNQTKLFWFLSLMLVSANCEVITVNKAELVPPKTNTPITKTEISFTENPPFNLKNKEGKIDELIEPSGVIAIDKEGNDLLVIDDKSDDIQADNLKVFKNNGDFVNEFRIDTAQKKPKWEALAKDDDEFIYVIGSHAGKDTEQIQKRSSVFQFKLEKDANGTYKIKSKVKMDITESLKTLEVNGIKIYDEKPVTLTVQKAKIEGLAIKTIGGKKNLIIGFREPDSLVRVYSAEIPLQLTENLKLTLIPYFSFNAGKTSDGEIFKLSTIEYIDEMKGFIVLTSSETTSIAANGKELPKFHGNAMWFINDEKLENSQVTNDFKQIEATKISEFQKDNKTEGICVLPNTEPNKFKFAIVYDNDTKDMKEADAKPVPLGKMQIVELTKN